MNLHQFTAALAMGLVLIILGAVPGLFDLILNSMNRFADSFIARSGFTSGRSGVSHDHPQPVTLAFAGAAIVLLAMLTYLAS